ncbi:MAG: hypothetical protein PHP25_03550 [Candidatus Moranbacteria bacterium]|nr:hypothetical protein [Candidatus Moranbacteria bacterium]
MILTTHILSGAALGANVENPWAVAVLSVVLHFVLDTLPHGDYLNRKSSILEFWKVLVDIAISILILIGIVNCCRQMSDPITTRNIFIGIFFSLLPDGTTFMYCHLGMKFLKPVKKFHEYLHFYKNGAPQRQFSLRNNLFDILVSLISLMFLVSQISFPVFH